MQKQENARTEFFPLFSPLIVEVLLRDIWSIALLSPS